MRGDRWGQAAASGGMQRSDTAQHTHCNSCHAGTTAELQASSMVKACVGYDSSMAPCGESNTEHRSATAEWQEREWRASETPAAASAAHICDSVPRCRGVVFFYRAAGTGKPRIIEESSFLPPQNFFQTNLGALPEKFIPQGGFRWFAFRLCRTKNVG